MNKLQFVSLTKLKECPLNPRQHYDQKKIEELAKSMKNGIGILEPLLVRPGASQDHDFEIIAGSRRYRAAKIAGLADAPVISRELTDGQALEIMVIENNQREDVNALEEAEGYKRLMERKYSLEVLAQKIGRSTKYIYDRLKLLQLIPEAKKLLLRDRISPGHAILLARLKPQEQKRAIDPENFEVWKRENLLFAPDDEPHEAPVKIVSVRELEAWIDQHIRFNKDVTTVDPMLFPETKEQLLGAFNEKEKIIQITHNYYTQPDAKEGNSERIYHSSSWKIADGTNGNKSCEKSVTGVIVLGPDRGKAYKVCVNKDCAVHWAKEKRERKKGAKANEQAGVQARYEAQNKRRQAEDVKREIEREAWRQAQPAILEACAEKLKSSKLGVYSEIIQRWELRGLLKDSLSLLGKPKTVEDWLRLVCLTLLMRESHGWDAGRSFIPRAKRLGVDVPAILKAHRAGNYAEPTCAKCGCTEAKACQGGCSWVKLDKKTNVGVCSACAPVQTSAPRGRKAKA